ncbi:hypothetical protein C8R44DRAFT_754258 [Mycena epipterygia]|nr:hypothetical protein C8R44DRAFT_754258 [Mycena epipterygia]
MTLMTAGRMSLNLDCWTARKNLSGRHPLRDCRNGEQSRHDVDRRDESPQRVKGASDEKREETGEEANAGMVRHRRTNCTAQPPFFGVRDPGRVLLPDSASCLLVPESGLIGSAFDVDARPDATWVFGTAEGRRQVGPEAFYSEAGWDLAQIAIKRAETRD